MSDDVIRRAVADLAKKWSEESARPGWDGSSYLFAVNSTLAQCAEELEEMALACAEQERGKGDPYFVGYHQGYADATKDSQ